VAQLFPRSANQLARVSIILGVFGVLGVGAVGAMFYRSPWYTNQDVVRSQPVPFYHEHHVGGLGLDCRFCHFNTENSAYAGMPPTHVCMTCHSQVWTEAGVLEPVRQSYQTDKSIEWTKVYRLADYAYFNHSAHVNKGIGCASCHGQVDKISLMYQKPTLQMSWCIECHKNPENFVRPKSEIFNMTENLPNQAEQGRQLVKDYNIQSRINCSTCHR
jgi:hypothetical protein